MSSNPNPKPKAASVFTVEYVMNAVIMFGFVISVFSPKRYQSVIMLLIGLLGIAMEIYKIVDDKEAYLKTPWNALFLLTSVGLIVQSYRQISQNRRDLAHSAPYI